MQYRPRRTMAIRNIGILSLALTILFIAAIIVIFLITRGTLDIYIGDEYKQSRFMPQNDAVTVAPAPHDGQFLRITANRRGKVIIECTDNENIFEYVRVLPGGVVYDVIHGSFSGYKQIMAALTVYIVIMTALFTASFILRCRYELFSYTTLYFGGASIFLSVVSFSFVTESIKLLTDSKTFFMYAYYSAIRSAGEYFMYLSLPFMVIFAISLAVNNIFLIRHEGRRLVNLLCLALSLMIIGGYGLYFILSELFSMGSEFQMRIYHTIISVYTTAFVYSEAMLISSMLCGLIAAKKTPAYNKTHIIILGCSVGSDGKPLPLLRARIDSALAFAQKQKQHNGADVKFVTSGGQGSDEVISEAECMKNYLCSCGIAAENILCEDRSTSTIENMRFSNRIIKAGCDEPKIAFSTSNYHVLRSGMIAMSEGINAEGIGCKTKWYFWPNAFIREFAGLLVAKRRQHILWVLLLIAVFALINMLLPM